MTSTSPPAALPMPPRRSAWNVQRAVLFALLIREFSTRVGGQWVGAVWTLFEPLAHMLMLVLVLGLMQTATLMPGMDFQVYLATGLVCYFLFQNLALRLLDGIDANRGLFAYRQVKPLDPLLARGVVETTMNLLVFSFTLGLLGWLGHEVVPARPLEAIAGFLLVALLGTGYGLCTAVLSHDRPRLRSLLRMLMLPLYFISGVVFPVDLLPRETLEWLLWNPLLHLVEITRSAFVPAYRPAEGINLMYPVLCTLGYWAVGLALYRADRRRLIAS
jgi:capsular polysaccharide transport system permease protein